MPAALQLLWLVPALPLAGFVANGLLALRRPPAPPAPPARRAVSIIGVGVLLAALALSVAIVLAFQRAGAAGPLVFPFRGWLPPGGLHPPGARQLHPLSPAVPRGVPPAGSLSPPFPAGDLGEDAPRGR